MADGTTKAMALMQRTKEMKETFAKVNETANIIKSYPDIKDADTLIKQLKKTIGYIGAINGKVKSLSSYIKGAEEAIKTLEPWVDARKETEYIGYRLPELELKCRALILDTGNNRTRQKELMQKIEVLRQRIHEISGTPLSQIPATPLRPPGLGSYVPRLYPTEESLTKAR
jgi:DNA repair exonuclease SbcCD ATPase subunit